MRIYAPMHKERFQAWRDKLALLRVPGLPLRQAHPRDQAKPRRGRATARPVAAVGKFGKAMNWMRPPGFAHRANDEPGHQPRRLPCLELRHPRQAGRGGARATRHLGPRHGRLEQTYRATSCSSRTPDRATRATPTAPGAA